MTREKSRHAIMGKPFIQWLTRLEAAIDQQQGGLAALAHFYEAADLRKTTRLLAEVASQSIDAELMRIAEDVRAGALRCQINAAKRVLALRSCDRDMHESLLRKNRYPALIAFLNKHEGPLSEERGRIW